MDSRLYEIRITTTLAALLVGACIVFESCYALQTVEDFSFLDFPLLAVTIAVLFFKRDSGTSPDLLRFGFAIVIAFVFGSIIVNFSQLTIVNSVKITLILVASYLVVRKMDFGVFISKCIKALEVVTTIALVLWVVTNVIGVTLPFPEFTNRNGISYQSGFIVFQFANYVKTTPAIGIFWEGGVFSSFLLIAIALWAARIAECRKRSVAVFVLGVFASGSTAGIILLPLAFAPRFFPVRSRIRVIALIVLLVVVGLVTVNLDSILLYLYGISPDLFGKIVDTSQLTTSTRLNSPAANMQIFLEAPVFGKGMGVAALEYSYIVQQSLAIDAQTSTSTFLMAAFGIGGIVINLLWIVGIMRQRELTFEQRVILLLLFILILNKETHYYTMALHCLLFFFLKKSGDIKLRMR